jgi:murein DD-endopeptidase MepM/ murein hydrolase activator NlpD
MTGGRWFVRGLALCAAVAFTGFLPGSTVSSRTPLPTINKPDFEQQLPAKYFILTNRSPDNQTENSREPIRVPLTVSKGDTLMAILVKAQVPRAEAHEAVQALKDVYNPRDLLPGTNIELNFLPTDEDGNDTGKPSFLGLNFEPSVERLVSVARTWAGFQADEVKKPLKTDVSRVAGTINNSLYEDAAKAGLPASVIAEVIHAFSYDVDFQRDIHPNDKFEVMYDRMVDLDGRTARNGKLLYAELTLGDTTHRIYRFATKDGSADYYNAKGESIRKALLRTPVDGARITSSFGRRMHPILGYTINHKGVDFGVASGTPIMAAGSGVVVEAGWKGGYGRYVRIRHNNEYSTAYAHMSKFGRDIKAGTHVTQGQIIGYVGATGMATGPHLHFEVLVHNKQINPMSAKVATGQKLEGKQLAAFKAEKGRLESQLAALADGKKLAASN